jgi:hypothetical protein
LIRAAQSKKPVNIALAAQNFFDSMRLPAPRPSYEPPHGTLVNLPTIFESGDHGALTGSFQLAGMTVTVTAKPTLWTWRFDPGHSEQFNQPGGRYPNTSVAYTYLTTGRRVVTVTTTWTASYTVNGAGNSRPVAGFVTRSGSVPVPVHEATSRLVSQ